MSHDNAVQALAVAGLAVVGRDYYGVFPLRGKLLNVRDASPNQVRPGEAFAAVFFSRGVVCLPPPRRLLIPCALRSPKTPRSKRCCKF